MALPSFGCSDPSTPHVREPVLDASPGQDDGDGAADEHGDDDMPRDAGHDDVAPDAAVDDLDADVPVELDGSVEPDGSPALDGSVGPDAAQDAGVRGIGYCTDMRVTRDGATVWNSPGDQLYRGDVVLRTSLLDPTFGRYSIAYRRGDGTLYEGTVDAADVEDSCPEDAFFGYYVAAPTALSDSQGNELCALPLGTLLRPHRATEEYGWFRFEFEVPPEGCDVQVGYVYRDYVKYVLAHDSAEPELPVLAPLRRGQPGTGTFDDRCALRDRAITLDGYDLIRENDGAALLDKLRRARESGVCRPGNRLSALNSYLFLADDTLIVEPDDEAKFEALMRLAAAGVGEQTGCARRRSNVYAHDQFMVYPTTNEAIVDTFVRFTRAGICSRITRIRNILGHVSLDGFSIVEADSAEQLVDDMVQLAESGVAEPGGRCSLQSYCIAIDGACTVSLTRDGRANLNLLMELGRLGECR